MAKGKGGDRRAQAAANGKRVGRPARARVPLSQRDSADPGIATRLLAMDGPPEHSRECDCSICQAHPKNCKCFFQCADCGCLEQNCECEEYRPMQIECTSCRTIAEHKICHCEICGWWDVLMASDKRLRFEGRRYLTDRRDGKPAQGVFVGDTREKVRELDFGDLPDFFAAGEPRAAGKPN